jgi:DNA polymerase zeta
VSVAVVILWSLILIGGRWRCLTRLAAVAGTVLDLLDTLDLPSRTAELARTFGIDFFSVLNR